MILVAAIAWLWSGPFAPRAHAQSANCAGADCTGPFCGDNRCNGDESVETCPQDCGGCTQPPGAFICYHTKLSRKSPKIGPIPNTRLEDFFEDLDFTVAGGAEVCNPAGREGKVPDSPTHLNRYQLVPSRRSRNLAKDVAVQTEFGTFELDLLLGDDLLVPTAESLAEPPLPLSTIDVDHFRCNDVTLHRGKFPEGVQITLTDQFYPTPRQLAVIGPARLCPAARENGQSVIDRCSVLVCFDVQPANGAAPFKAAKRIYTDDEFGSLVQDTVGDDEVCVPGSILLGAEQKACLLEDGP